jgi:hypothetical protein
VLRQFHPQPLEASKYFRIAFVFSQYASHFGKNERFRFTLGEDITLVGQGEKYVHMLAIGGMQNVTQGVFLPDDSSNLAVDLWINAIKKIKRFGKGYSPDFVQSLFGKLYSFTEVLDMLLDNTLTFAAHPYNFAQVPPSKWDEKDLAYPRLNGHEFWNVRIRRSTNQTDNPFSRRGWTDPPVA